MCGRIEVIFPNKTKEVEGCVVVGEMGLKGGRKAECDRNGCNRDWFLCTVCGSNCNEGESGWSIAGLMVGHVATVGVTTVSFAVQDNRDLKLFDRNTYETWITKRYCPSHCRCNIACSCCADRCKNCCNTKVAREAAAKKEKAEKEAKENIERAIDFFQRYGQKEREYRERIEKQRDKISAELQREEEQMEREEAERREREGAEQKAREARERQAAAEALQAAARLNEIEKLLEEATLDIEDFDFSDGEHEANYKISLMQVNVE